MIMIMIIIMIRVLGDLGPRAWQNDFSCPKWTKRGLVVVLRSKKSILV